MMPAVLVADGELASAAARTSADTAASETGSNTQPMHKSPKHCTSASAYHVPSFSQLRDKTRNPKITEYLKKELLPENYRVI